MQMPLIDSGMEKQQWKPFEKFPLDFPVCQTHLNRCEPSLFPDIQR
jgi:hypothetical protein